MWLINKYSYMKKVCDIEGFPGLANLVTTVGHVLHKSMSFEENHNIPSSYPEQGVSPALIVWNAHSIQQSRSNTCEIVFVPVVRPH